MKRLTTGLLVSTMTISAAACGGGDAPSPAEMAQGAEGGGAAVSLTGAGATFPYPIYSKWFSSYGDSHPVRVNYQSIGSGGGIQQLTEGTVDFGASDAPMNEEEMAKAPNTLHFPTVIRRALRSPRGRRRLPPPPAPSARAPGPPRRAASSAA